MPLDSKAVKDVFLAAIEKPTRAERDAFLEGACAADDALRRRVEALLKEHEQSGSFPDFLGLGNGTQDHLPAPDAITATCGEPIYSGGDRPLDFLAPPRQPEHLGRLGHYEIHSIIGCGGMGVVLKAFDERLARTVAVKVLAPQFAANAAARRRFIREAKAIAAVAHEHVVTVHAVSDDDDPHPYIVMQLIQGVSLQDRLDKTGPLELKEILRIGLQAARGLAAAHAQGLVHRDIKPANILLENGVERVKITDFGLARAVDDASVTQTGVIAGTPLFMSPEQAAGDAVDPRSDLFSLGSVLYMLCTGRPPFRAPGTMAVMKRVIEDEPRPIREINPDIPDWLEAIIAKLHAKNPADRFQSAKEVADLLEQHLAHVQQPSLVAMPARVQLPQHPRNNSLALPRALLVAPIFVVVGIAIIYMLGIIPLSWLGAAMLLLLLPVVASLLTGITLLEARRAPHPADATIVGESRSDAVHRPAASPWSRVLGSVLVVLLFPVVALLELLLMKYLPHGIDKAFIPINVVLAVLIGFWLVRRYRRKTTARAAAPRPEPPRTNRSHTTVWQVAVVVILAMLAVAFGPVILRHLGNRGQVVLEPHAGLVSVIVLQNDVVVHDWMDVRTAHTLNLSPGKYKLNAGCAIGYQMAGWEITTDGLFGGLSSHQGNDSCEIYIERGQRITVRAITRPTPQSPSAPAPVTDKDRLQGTWIAVSAEYAGQPLLADELKELKLEFTGGQVRFTTPGGRTGGGKTEGGSFKLDAGVAPKEIDVIGQKDQAGLLGIYRLDGDLLTVCMDQVKGRPTAFESKPGTTRWLVVMRKATSEEEGFVQLFNGKDLTGWKYHPNQPGNWKVENGHLVGRQYFGRPNHLFSERADFQDFHLRAEVMIDATGNSGIYFRSPFELRFLGGLYPPAYEAQIYNDDSPTNNDAYKTGSLHGVVMYDKILVRGEVWFILEIIARGPHVITRVNGVTAVDETLPFNPERKEPRGHIALQAEKGTVRFRKIEIKELPPTPKAGEFVPLFNGKDLTGWITHPDQPGQWKVRDGILTGSGERSHLYSERGDYRNFHLRAEVRINDGGNSGLYFRSGFGPDFDSLRITPGSHADARIDRKAGLPLGYEADIKLDNESSRTGSVWSLRPPPTPPLLKPVTEPLVKPGTWFTLEVIARGNHIVTKIDGKTALDWVDEVNGHKTGHFALQVSHPKTVVEFRKIEVKELPDQP